MRVVVMRPVGMHRVILPNNMHDAKMLDIEQLIKSNKVYQDQAGRWIVRDPAAAYKLYPKSAEASFRASVDFQFSSGLLHPEDRLARINLSAWFDREWELLSNIDINDNATLKKLAASLNMLALILASAGLYQSSIDLCHLSIELFFKIAQENSGFALSFTIQPWINLSRIDRLLGNYSQALLRLDHLHADNNFLKNSEIISQARHEFYGKNNEITRVIDNCRVIDYLKSLLEMNSNLIIDFPKALLTSSYLKSAYAEILLLSLMKKQDYSGALDLANQQFCEGDPRMIPIFALRRAELLFLMGDEATTQQEVNKLLKFARKDLLPKDFSPDLNNLAFCVALINLAQKLPENKDAIELAKTVLAQYQQLKDELGVIKVLKQLKAMGLKQYQIDLEEITKSCDYVFISSGKQPCNKMLEKAERILNKLREFLQRV